LMGIQLPPRKRGPAPHNFRAMSIVTKQLDGWLKTPLGVEVDLGSGHIVLDGDPAPSPQKGHSSSPLFSPRYCGHGRPSQLRLSSCTSQPQTKHRRLMAATKLYCLVTDADVSEQLAHSCHTQVEWLGSSLSRWENPAC